MKLIFIGYRYIHLNVRVPESGGFLAAMKTLLAGGTQSTQQKTNIQINQNTTKFSD
jgi:hypothetical protein